MYFPLFDVRYPLRTAQPSEGKGERSPPTMLKQLPSLQTMDCLQGFSTSQTSPQIVVEFISERFIALLLVNRFNRIDVNPVTQIKGTD